MDYVSKLGMKRLAKSEQSQVKRVCWKGKKCASFYDQSLIVLEEYAGKLVIASVAIAEGAERKIVKASDVMEALRVVKKAHRTMADMELTLAVAPFHRLIRKSAPDQKFTKDALTLIQFECESYMRMLFECANLIAIHAGRVTLGSKDIKLAVNILSRC